MSFGHPTATENLIAAAINDAEEIVESHEVAPQKPRLLVEHCDPDRTVASLRDILRDAGQLYDRGSPVRLVRNQVSGSFVARDMTPECLVLMAHHVCRPYKLKIKQGETVEVDARLPRDLAAMYLNWPGEWELPPLNGISTTPLLQDDGTINSLEGYDITSGMWCEVMPDVKGLVPARPTKDQAASALLLIRNVFKTFPFADAQMMNTGCDNVPVVDIGKPPGRDESSFVAALLTAACRPSLHLAPGVLLRAPAISGAGAGKGLLARCICIIAFGREPHAVTAGGTADELEKRIAAELIEGGPALFLDNLNNTAFKSNLLASAITERPARVRLLGKSQMVPLNVSAFVVLTGNGLTVSEDLARRFLAVDLDPRTEDPEARPFTTDIRVEVTKRRRELLAALLTIWRWGRTSTDLKGGLPLGSFDQWCRWARDPLLALGCKDPVERVSEAKQRDSRRQMIVDLCSIWWEKHRDQSMPLRELHEEVKRVLDPHGRGRQHLAAQLDKLTGMRLAGFVLTRQAPAGKWGVATYALKKTDGEDHRGHRGHRVVDLPKCGSDASDGPYAPYANFDRGKNQQRSQPQTSCAPSFADPPRHEPPGWEGRV